MATTLEIYQELSETIPLAPLKVIKKFTASQWDKAIKQIPEIHTLRLSIESKKRDEKIRVRKFFNSR